MKVLYQNRPEHLFLGGDMFQLKATMREMANLGVEVEFNDQALIKPALKLRWFDIVHTFNFGAVWTKYQIWAAKKAGRKVVCSMIYTEEDRNVSFEDQQIMADSLDAMFFVTQGEVNRVKAHLKLDDSKVHIVANGIEKWWFEGSVVSAVDLPPYLLTTGRLEAFKGQLEAAEVCQKLGLQYVCIGQIAEAAYAKHVESLGTIIMPPMEQKWLRKFYAGCKAYIQPSKSETWGLAVDEAGSQGANVILTEGCERDDIPDVIRCRHKNRESIEAAIKEALSRPGNFKFKEVLRKRTWDVVAKQIYQVYEQILKT